MLLWNVLIFRIVMWDCCEDWGSRVRPPNLMVFVRGIEMLCVLSPMLEDLKCVLVVKGWRPEEEVWVKIHFTGLGLFSNSKIEVRIPMVHGSVDLHPLVKCIDISYAFIHLIWDCSEDWGLRVGPPSLMVFVKGMEMFYVLSPVLEDLKCVLVLKGWRSEDQRTVFSRSLGQNSLRWSCKDQSSLVSWKLWN